MPRIDDMHGFAVMIYTLRVMIYNFCEIDDIHIFDVMIYRPLVILERSDRISVG